MKARSLPSFVSQLAPSLALAFLATTLGAQNPTFTWAMRAGGPQDDQGKAITTDMSGNLFIAGFFNSTAAFGTTNLNSSGARDAFVAKVDRSGNFIWVRQVTGDGDDEAYGAGTDQNGNVYVGGNFPSASAGFGGTTLSTRGGDDIFLAKYDGTGNFLWVRQAGGIAHDTVVELSMDSAANCYLAGYFRATATFGSSNITVNGSTTYADAYFAKYDKDGNFQWVRGFGGSGHDVTYRTVVDDSGNNFVTGYFNSTVNFGGTNLTSNGNNDIFLAKYNSGGTLLWARQAGGTAADVGTSLAVDANGNVYVCGYFRNSANFGSINLTSRGNTDVFIAKYDGSGNLHWIRQGGGGGQDYAWSLVLDGDANCYVAGDAEGTATFDAIAITNNAASLFVAKYDSSGIVQWVKVAAGTNAATCRSIARDNSGTLFLTGWFSGDLKFDEMKISSAGLQDIFAARLHEIPRLNFSLGNGQFILNWPTNIDGWVLQWSTNLSFPSNWTDSTNSPTISAGQFFATNALSGQSQFYRLRKP
jgi:hypothetical protein